MQFKEKYITSGTNYTQKFYDQLFTEILAIDNINNNEIIIEQILESVNQFINKPTGYIIMNISHNNRQNIIICFKTDKYVDFIETYLYTNTIDISTGTSFKLEVMSDINLHQMINEKCLISNLPLPY